MVQNNNSPISLKGHLLIAMPRMSDPRFHHAVIFLCVHDDKGAMGMGINQKLMAPDFQALIGQLGIAPDTALPPRFLNMPIFSGGPVEAARGFLLHSGDFQEKDTIVIDDQFGISGTIDSLRAAIANPPEKMLFTLGYAGWGAGQLEQELQDNAWMTIPATQRLVFDTAPEDMWDASFSALGVNPAMLSSVSGNA